MAKFQQKDWVQITPSPDSGWKGWDEAHDYFCSRVGRIFSIEESLDKPEDPEEDDVKVEVYFGDSTFTEGPQWYWASFKKRHLIQVSEALAKQYMHDEQAAVETNNFEDIVRRKRDEIFRHIFSKPKEEQVIFDDIDQELLSFENDKTL